MLELARADAPLATPDPDTRPAPRDLVVLKFGSSVLRGPDDIPEVVTEIYRVVRDGHRVLAIVSAFAGVTDRLLAEARAAGCAHDNPHLPRYVAQGEEAAAALLAVACDRAGLCVAALNAVQLGIEAKGLAEDATPVGLDRQALRQAFGRADVVIAPGYVGNTPAGEVVLLGRGGSDLSAVFLADQLGATRVRLVKDVDGVYDRDPNREAEALRFGAVDWKGARAVSDGLVQARALEYAETVGLEVEVGAIGRLESTHIGRRLAPPAPAVKPRRLRVALAGCGVVGAGLYARLARCPDAFDVRTVLVRDPGKARGLAGEIAGLTGDLDAFLSVDADVVVDVLSSAELGAEIGERALARGVHLVSANKQAVVRGHTRLRAAAEVSGASLLYSAAVGGGAPLIETVRLARRHEPVVAVEGVLNGTVNFLIDSLARGESLEAGLAAARSAGLAEEDASADLDGLDAAAKLQILAWEAFGRTLGLDEIERQSLSDLGAGADWARLRQVSRVELVGEELRASIRFEERAELLQVRSDQNLLRVTGDSGAVWTGRGRGAGRGPTTESVFADLVDLRAGCGGSTGSGFH